MIRPLLSFAAFASITPAFAQDTNPAPVAVLDELRIVACEYRVPSVVLFGVAWHGSQFRQFDRDTAKPGRVGVLSVPVDGRADAARLRSDWRYNIREGAKLYDCLLRRDLCRFKGAPGAHLLRHVDSVCDHRLACAVCFQQRLKNEIHEPLLEGSAALALEPHRPVAKDERLASVAHLRQIHVETLIARFWKRVEHRLADDIATKADELFVCSVHQLENIVRAAEHGEK